MNNRDGIVNEVSELRWNHECAAGNKRRHSVVYRRRVRGDRPFNGGNNNALPICRA
jgi:hypothetical protein